MPYISKKNRVRVADLPRIISSNSNLHTAIKTSVQIYIFALMIAGYSKSLTNMAAYFGVTICSLSRMLIHPMLGEELEISLNRNVRKVLASYLNGHKDVTIEIIVDATMLTRASQKAENVSLYHSNGKKVWGHRITNVGLLLDRAYYIPIASIPHYTKRYARACGLNYLTEGMMVQRWLRKNMAGLMMALSSASIKAQDVTFLLDAGYDNAAIQKAIRAIGCHFLMMIKSTRSVGGCQVAKYFKKHKNLAWKNAFFKKTTNGKTKLRKYRIRTATRVKLARVGLVNVVCSEKTCGSRNKKTRRFLVTSRLEICGREVLNRYFGRWTIETWHKQIKQNYGFDDCAAHNFVSIENHLQLCLIAYLLHLEGLLCLPAKGVSIGDFLNYSVRKLSRTTLRLISGSSRFENEMKFYREELFTKSA